MKWWFTSKRQTSLEMLARVKRSSLLRTFVNYGGKKFYSNGPSKKMKRLEMEQGKKKERKKINFEEKKLFFAARL